MLINGKEASTTTKPIRDLFKKEKVQKPNRKDHGSNKPYERRENVVNNEKGIKTVKNDEYGRRKWIVDDEAIKKHKEDAEALDNAPDSMIPQEKTTYLQSRKYELNLRENLGKSWNFGNKGTEVTTRNVFACEVCDLTFHDSISYMDH